MSEWRKHWMSCLIVIASFVVIVTGLIMFRDPIWQGSTTLFAIWLMLMALYVLGLEMVVHE